MTTRIDTVLTAPDRHHQLNHERQPMPSYSIHVTANTIDEQDPAALMEVVERVAAALRPALPYGTAIEDVHVGRDKPDAPEPSLFVEAGDTIEIAEGHTTSTVRVLAVTESTDESPARVEVKPYRASTMPTALDLLDGDGTAGSAQ